MKPPSRWAFMAHRLPWSFVSGPVPGCLQLPNGKAGIQLYHDKEAGYRVFSAGVSGIGYVVVLYGPR